MTFYKTGDVKPTGKPFLPKKGKKEKEKIEKKSEIAEPKSKIKK